MKIIKAKIISLSRNFGSHAALRAGISISTGELVCFNYADLQDPLELILQMEEKTKEGNEIIWAHQGKHESIPGRKNILFRLCLPDEEICIQQFS